jgi:hypothetical protein
MLSARLLSSAGAMLVYTLCGSVFGLCITILIVFTR